MKKLFIFRHGETDGDKSTQLAGKLDMSLNEKGHEQSKNLISFFKKNPVDILFSSDLIRAKETAELLSKGVNIPLILTAHLREINIGKAKGLEWDTVLERFPDINWSKRFNPENKMMKFPKGESYHEFKGRVLSFLRFVSKKREETNIAISTHDGVMEVILNAMNLPSKGRFKNTEVLCLEYSKDKLHFIKRVISK